MKYVTEFNGKGKRILVRCDFNVPLDEHGNVTDDFKIKKSLPTIEYLMKNQAKIILMSHLDPENQGFVSPEFSLKNIAKKLSAYISTPVIMANNCVGEETKSKVAELKEGEVLLLENLRFHKGEIENSPEFAKKLSELGDIYINDAFSVCHRAHTSMIGVPKHLPHGAGLLLKEEIENLSKILKDPIRPLVAIVGGAKVETKAKFIEKISEIADLVIVSGLIKKEMIEKNIHFKNTGKIIGPDDNLDALDIDEKTIALFQNKVAGAKTILWNGPFGKFEDEQYKKGTLEIARAIMESKAFSVVGGGETVEFLNREGILEDFSWVSTGGGAMLAYLSGEVLPGLEALEK